MPTFPVPVFAAVLFGFLAAALALRQGRVGWVSLLCAACGLQALIISLVQHYGLAWLRPVQPVTAVAVPVIAWLTFQATAVRPLGLGRDGWHVIVPAIALVLVVLKPASLDGLVPLIFALYGAALLRAVWPGGESLPRLRLDTGALPGRIWTAVALCLIGSALSDLGIALAHIGGHAAWQPWIVSTATVVTLIVLAWLALSPGLTGEEDGEDEESPTPLATGEDNQIVARLNALLDETALYLDPDLTLSRLARRLGLPVKSLSAAINRVTGENVSRFINTRRIAHACDRLRQGDSVTAAWLASGFNAKSNFNREFLRVTGVAPSDWLAKAPRAG